MQISYFQLLIGAAAAGAIAYSALRVGFLVRSGAWAAFILGTVVFGLGGPGWSLPLIVFFISGSLLSRFDRRRKQWLDETFEKGSARDAGQVLANGGVAGLMVIAHTFVPANGPFDQYIITAYLGALAAAAADTWGTELGVLGHGRTIGLPSFREVPKGTSGGISLAGTVGAFLGAFLVAMSGFRIGIGIFLWIIPATFGGMVGMLADSIAGGHLQARYRCTACGAVTERSVHCDVPATITAGRRAITNDVVNGICTLVGAIASVIFLELFYVIVSSIMGGAD
jgi:uncharacterized protein (TIGR00297 family)